MATDAICDFTARLFNVNSNALYVPIQRGEKSQMRIENILDRNGEQTETILQLLTLFFSRNNTVSHIVLRFAKSTVES